MWPRVALALAAVVGLLSTAPPAAAQAAPSVGEVFREVTPSVTASTARAGRAR